MANVNFLSRVSRYVLERRFTKFSEKTQYNSHYAVQGIQGHRFGYQCKERNRRCQIRHAGSQSFHQCILITKGSELGPS